MVGARTYVGSCSEGHSAGTIAVWEHFSNASPDHRAPGCGESYNENAGEGDHDTSARSSLVRSCRSRIVIEVADESKDHEADEHTQGTDNETNSTTKLLNHVKTEEGGAKVDATKNHGCNVGVADTHAAEDGSTIVEEVVGTR